MKISKIIFHIDADSFFVAAELSLRPELKNQDIAIAKNKSHSIVSALSYSAKLKGAKVPMKLFEVKKIIPNILVLQPNMNLYTNISKKIFLFLKKNYTSQIEIGSIDEWFLDVTELSSKFQSPIVLAEKIQKEILEKFNISVSIGISYNRFLSKMASELKKPFGITLIRRKDIPQLIWPLPISLFIGIGKTLTAKLINQNIITIKDLAQIERNDPKFKKIFKNTMDYYIDNANGVSNEGIDVSKNNSLSLGAQSTIDYNQTNDLKYINDIMLKLAKRVSNELISKNLHTSSIALYIKYLNSQTSSISCKLSFPTNDFQIIYNQAVKLFFSHWNEQNIITLGISAHFLKVSYLINVNNSLFDSNTIIDSKQYKKQQIINIINETNKKINSNNLRLLKDKE